MTLTVYLTACVSSKKQENNIQLIWPEFPVPSEADTEVIDTEHIAVSIEYLKQLHKFQIEYARVQDDFEAIYTEQP